MLLIHCPHCQRDRPEIEFRHAGEAHIVRPPLPSSVSDEEWTAYLALRSNPKGTTRERWRHVHGCGRFFNAQRHTVTDLFDATYPVGTQPPGSGEQG